MYKLNHEENGDTQIQLPDWLFTVARDVAASKEISLAELVRRGLEYMVSVTPEARGVQQGTWQLPRPHLLASSDPFAAPDWREQLHTHRLRVAEDGDPYGVGEHDDVA